MNQNTTKAKETVEGRAHMLTNLMLDSASNAITKMKSKKTVHLS